MNQLCSMQSNTHFIGHCLWQFLLLFVVFLMHFANSFSYRSGVTKTNNTLTFYQMYPLTRTFLEQFIFILHTLHTFF